MRGARNQAKLALHKTIKPLIAAQKGGIVMFNAPVRTVYVVEPVTTKDEAKNKAIRRAFWQWRVDNGLRDANRFRAEADAYAALKTTFANVPADVAPYGLRVGEVSPL